MKLELTGDIRTHDPTIVKENGVYYRFQTGEGLPFHQSADLRHWESAGEIFPVAPDWTAHAIPKSTRHLWAPEIIRRGDEWRVYYSVSSFGSQKSAIGLVVNKSLDAKSADYGWRDLGAVLQSDESCRYNAIDPCVVSEGGADYLLFGSFWGGLFLTKLTEEGFVAKDTEVRNIATRQLEKDNSIEGGFLFRRGDWWYLFASFDFCCRSTASTYRIVYGRAKTLADDFVDRTGKKMTEGGGTVLRDGSSFARWAGTGHNSVFCDDDGKTYLVYHAYDREDEGKSKLQIEDISFDEDGWICL